MNQSQKRNTVQRMITLEAARHLANHPSAEEVYGCIRQSYPHISRGTVYRNLSSLCEDGELSRVRVFGGADRFDHDTRVHRHIICEKCGCVGDVFDVPEKNSDEEASRQTGFSRVKHEVSYSGICPTCNQTDKSV